MSVPGSLGRVLARPHPPPVSLLPSVSGGDEDVSIHQFQDCSHSPVPYEVCKSGRHTSCGGGHSECGLAYSFGIRPTISTSFTDETKQLSIQAHYILTDISFTVGSRYSLKATSIGVNN